MKWNVSMKREKSQLNAMQDMKGKGQLDVIKENKGKTKLRLNFKRLSL
jgi:hypothetical protein